VFNVGIESGIGTPTVVTTTNRGMNAEEWAEVAVNRIVAVSANAPPQVREQAFAYKAVIKALLIGYFDKVAKSERSTAKTIWDQEGLEGLMHYFEGI
jgi:hypothetical protein